MTRPRRHSLESYDWAFGPKSGRDPASVKGWLRYVFGNFWVPQLTAPTTAPSSAALDLDLRHAGNARLLTEAEIREIERETGRRL